MTSSPSSHSRDAYLAGATQEDVPCAFYGPKGLDVGRADVWGPEDDEVRWFKDPVAAHVTSLSDVDAPPVWYWVYATASEGTTEHNVPCVLLQPGGSLVTSKLTPGDTKYPSDFFLEPEITVENRHDVPAGATLFKTVQLGDGGVVEIYSLGSFTGSMYVNVLGPDDVSTDEPGAPDDKTATNPEAYDDESAAKRPCVV